MFEIFVQFYLENEGQICINNTHYLTLKEKQKVRTKLKLNEYFLLEYKPINNENFCSFLSKITFKNGVLSTDSNNIRIVELGGNSFYLIILPSKNSVKILSSHKKEFYLKSKKILVYGNKVEILDKGKFSQIDLCANLADFESELIGSVLILFSKEKIKNNLHLIDLLANNHIKLSADKYLIKNQEIQSIQNLKTYAKHKKVKVFNLSDLSLKEEFIGYESIPRTQFAKNLLPYAFLQNVFAGDFKLAQTFLDENEFKNQINKTAMQGFFGDFESFGTPQISVPSHTLSLIYKKNKNTYQSRYFTFEINDSNKIANIFEFKPNLKTQA